MRISNGSPNDFYLGFTETTANNPTPRNTPSVGTGNVTVINRSSNSITARYNLPRGQFYGPNNYTWMYQPISPGGRDRTTSIAAGTKVTVDGYNGQEFFVRKGDELTLVVDDNGIGQQAAGGNPGRGNPGTGRLPNQVATIPAGTTWKSGSFPAGTRAVVAGSGVTSPTTYELPATVSVSANGGQGELSYAMSGTYLDIRNNSSNDVIVEFLPPSMSSSPSNGNPPPPSNNQPTGFTGNINVRNQSGKTITARYTLPAGKTYFFGGANHPSLYVKLDDKDKDATPNIAAGTKVTVDGYNQEFYVRANDDLDLTVFDSGIGQSAAGGSPSPAPNPSPPRLADSGNNNSPAPPAPSPMPNPSENGGTSRIPDPQPYKPGDYGEKEKPLTKEVADSLTKRINAEAYKILDEFERASKARVEPLQRDLAQWDFAAAVAPQIGRAAINGDPQKVWQLFVDVADKASDEGSADPTEAAVTLWEPLKAIATLRASLLKLKTKMLAGQSIAGLAVDFTAIKELANEHKSPGLASAMSMVQQGLIIRDLINSSVTNAFANTPLIGDVTRIQHPFCSDDSYRGKISTGSLILTRAIDGNITVNGRTFERPSLASLQQAAGTTLFNFEGSQPAPAGPTEASDLLDLLKAAQ